MAMPRAMKAQPRQSPTRAQPMLMAQSMPMPRATAQPTPNTIARHELAHTLRPSAHEMPRLTMTPEIPRLNVQRMPRRGPRAPQAIAYELMAMVHEPRAVAHELMAMMHDLRATAHEPNATAYWLRATAHELMLMAKPMPRPMAQPRGVAHELMAMAEPAPRAVAQPMPRSTKPVPRPMVQPRAISRKHMSMAHEPRAHEPRLMAYKLAAMP